LSTQDLQAENVGDVVSRLEKEYFTEAYAAWWAQDEEGEGVEFEGPKRMLTERFGELFRRVEVRESKRCSGLLIL
jgi:hypothetical protein